VFLAERSSLTQREGQAVVARQLARGCAPQAIYVIQAMIERDGEQGPGLYWSLEEQQGQGTEAL
jgi:hypothetical protein